jgi:hypothetical protein
MKFKGLEHWKNRRSYQVSLPVCPVYKSKTTGFESIVLHEVCRQEKELTINPQSSSGFSEITIIPIEQLIPHAWRHITEFQEPLKLSPLEIARKLKVLLKEYYLETWESDKFHLVQCSGGMDSRINAWILKELEQERGKDWLGDIHFVCHHDEGSAFKTAMKQVGWGKHQYSVHRESWPQSGDYYDYGDFDRNMNAFCGPGLNYWSEVISREEEKEAVLVNGNLGGELFSYPLQYPSRNDWNRRFASLMSYFSLLHSARCSEFIYWNDILMPYSYYKYLDFVFKIPKEHFLLAERLGQKTDLLRASLLDSFGDKVPNVFGHNYCWDLSDERKKYMLRHWKGSKFYRDFKDNRFVSLARPDIVPRESIGARLYSLATSYEYV